MNKKLIIILLCIIFLVFIVIIFRENIIRLKLSTRLNYHENVAYITIYDDRLIEVADGKLEIEINSRRGIEIHNREDIEKIINYLNSLELIEDNLTEYVDVDLDEVGYFSITIFRDGYVNDYQNNLDALEHIAFQTNYLEFIPGGHDWKTTRYYIKNSGYDPKTKTSKTFEFLYDLINKSE